MHFWAGGRTATKAPATALELAYLESREDLTETNPIPVATPNHLEHR